MLEIILIVIGIIVFGSLLFFGIQMSVVQENTKKTNEKIFQNLYLHDFKVDKIFYINEFYCSKDNKTKKQLLVDYGNKKIGLIDYNISNILIVDFSSILNYEIYENGSTVTNGTSVSGWVLGGFNATTEGVCNELKLIIRTNKIESPQVCYKIEFLGNGENKNSSTYKDAVSSLQEITAFLGAVIKENETNISNALNKNKTDNI